MRGLLFVALLALGTLALAQAPVPYPNEPAAGTEIVNPTDGALMVWVPSGYFIMGMDKDEADKACKALGSSWEQAGAWEWMPSHRVYVPGFFMDRYEITNELWDKYAAATNAKPMKGIAKSPKPVEKDDYAMYPATTVFWKEAQQYANWAGKTLPTEAQWEKAARGTDGRVFPWGNEPLTQDRGVFLDLKTKQTTMIEPVGSHPTGASPYGCMDMAGNVYEWTCEWMEPYQNNPDAAKMFDYTGHVCGVLRGGSFYHAFFAFISAKRFGFEPGESYYHVGFRTAWSPPDNYFATQAFKDAQAKAPARKTALDALRAKAKPIPKGWIGG